MCERLHSGQGSPCPEAFPDDVPLWCDYCRRNYELWLEERAEQARWDELVGGDLPLPLDLDAPPAGAPEEAPCPLEDYQVTAYWDWLARQPGWVFDRLMRWHWPSRN